jgi:hypothetical protein
MGDLLSNVAGGHFLNSLPNPANPVGFIKSSLNQAGELWGNIAQIGRNSIAAQDSTANTLYQMGAHPIAELTGVTNASYIYDNTNPVTGVRAGTGETWLRTIVGSVQLMGTALAVKGALPDFGVRTNAQLVQDVATRADAWAARKGITGTPQDIGKAKHAYAEDLLTRYQDIYGMRGLTTEVRYVNQQVWRPQSGMPTRDSVILDVVDGPLGNPTAIYDYKFGAAGLTPARIGQIRTVTGFQNTPVIQVRP